MVKKKKRLKHKIIAVMMPMTMILLIGNSLYHYNVMKERLLNDFKVSQVSAEAHILDALYLIDAGYRMLEIKLESDLNEKTDAFLETYNHANGKLNQTDLDELKASFGNAYDFLIIDKDTTIVQSSMLEGLGFNFTKFSPELGKKIDAIRMGNVTWFEQLRTNVATGRLSKFAYIPSQNHEVLLEVAYSIDGFTNIIEELKPHSIIEQMIDVSPQIKDIKIYDVYGYVYSDSGEKTEPHTDLLQLIERVKVEKEITIKVNDEISKKYLYVDLNQYRDKTLADTDRIIEIVYDMTEVNNSLKDLGFTTMAGILIISVFLIMSIFYISERLTRPIEVLKLGVQKIAKGDYSSRVKVISNDEVGELAETFNHMAEELSHSFSKIEGQNAILEDYNRNLERMVTDRTQEIKERNSELEEKNKELELAWIKANEATESKGQFLAMMSHEIRTPINAIVGMTYLMFRTKLENRQREFIQKIQHSAENLLEIVNDVLDISKLEAGKTKLESLEFNLEEVFEMVSNQIGFKAAEKNIELIFSNDSQIQKSLIGDPLRLRQVLLNLLNNATKFTEKGEIIVETQLAGENEEEIKIRFSVKDTGIGIDPSRLAMLFQPFQQADDSITRKYGGTGLGLSICKHFVNLMAGEIWAESKLGQGSVFYFTGIFKKGQREAEIYAGMDVLKDLKILIVDDSSTTREVLAEMLNPYFAHTSLAISGEEALEKIRSGNKDNQVFDLILMDWKMTGIDGLETAAAIKQLNNMEKVPLVLMLTGYDIDEAKKHQMSHHVDAFLSKPIIGNMLIATIAKIMGIRMPSFLPEKNEVKTEHVYLEALEEVAVLIAEDNLVNQQIMRVLLEHPLFRVDMVPNGIHAVQSALQYHYDLIFMDIQMPELDGLEATRRIRQQIDNPSLPIIAMTAHALEEERLKCLEAGMDDFISKPIVDTTLYELMLLWIPHKNMRITKIDFSDQSEKVEPINGLSALNIKQPLINLRGDWTKYVQLLQSFRNQYGDAGLRLTEFLLENQGREALNLVHSIRGSVGNLGGMDLFVVAQTLEIQIQQELVEPNHPNVLAFKDELHQLIEEMDTIIEEKTQIASSDHSSEQYFSSEQLMPILREKLKKGEADAEKLLSILAEVFNKEDQESIIQRLIMQIKNFDYEDALVSLEELEDMKNQNTGGIYHDD